MVPTEVPDSPDIISTGCKEQRSQWPAKVRKWVHLQVRAQITTHSLQRERRGAPHPESGARTQGSRGLWPNKHRTSTSCKTLSPFTLNESPSCCLQGLTLASSTGLSGDGFHKDLSSPWVAKGNPGGQHYNALLPTAKGSPGTGKRYRWPWCFPKGQGQVAPRNTLSPEQGYRKAALGRTRAI